MGEEHQRYRAYKIGPGGHIQSRVDLFCDSEEAAKAEAKRWVGGHDVELWQYDRRIAIFKHEWLPQMKRPAEAGR